MTSLAESSSEISLATDLKELTLSGQESLENPFETTSVFEVSWNINFANPSAYSSSDNYAWFWVKRSTDLEYSFGHRWKGLPPSFWQIPQVICSSVVLSAYSCGL